MSGKESSGGKKEPMNRVRTTQRSMEAKQFSSVKLPRKSEMDASTHKTIHLHDQEGTTTPSAGGGASSSMVFDPIPNDGMFMIPEESEYWPPPPLEDLAAAYAKEQATVPGPNGQLRSEEDIRKAAVGMSADGMDLFDRRADDKQSQKDAKKIIKQKGELSHPRGKTAVSSKVSFDAEDSD